MNKQETSIEGIGTLKAGEYHDIVVEGIGKGQGDLQFQRFVIEGKFKSEGQLTGDMLEVDGILQTAQQIKAKTLTIDGFLHSKSGNVYGDRIEVDGVLICTQEISADEIDVNGYVEAELLSGDHIVLNYRKTSRLSKFMYFANKKNAVHKVKSVECTYLEASAFTCEHICAQEIRLTNFCNIELIECDGTIYMDETCRVGSIQGDYTIIS